MTKKNQEYSEWEKGFNRRIEENIDNLHKKEREKKLGGFAGTIPLISGNIKLYYGNKALESGNPILGGYLVFSGIWDFGEGVINLNSKKYPNFFEKRVYQLSKWINKKAKEYEGYKTIDEYMRGDNHLGLNLS